jgi:hypothetical protein
MSKTAKTVRELEVWQKAHEFVLAAYRLTSGGGFQASFRVLARRRHQQTRHAKTSDF